MGIFQERVGQCRIIIGDYIYAVVVEDAQDVALTARRRGPAAWVAPRERSMQTSKSSGAKASRRR